MQSQRSFDSICKMVRELGMTDDAIVGIVIAMARQREKIERMSKDPSVTYQRRKLALRWLSIIGMYKLIKNEQ